MTEKTVSCQRFLLRHYKIKNLYLSAKQKSCFSLLLLFEKKKVAKSATFLAYFF